MEHYNVFIENSLFPTLNILEREAYVNKVVSMPSFNPLYPMEHCSNVSVDDLPNVVYELLNKGILGIDMGDDLEIVDDSWFTLNGPAQGIDYLIKEPFGVKIYSSFVNERYKENISLAYHLFLSSFAVDLFCTPLIQQSNPDLSLSELESELCLMKKHLM